MSTLGELYHQEQGGVNNLPMKVDIHSDIIYI